MIPLWKKLHDRDGPYYPLVKIIGYDGVTPPGPEIALKTLTDKFGRQMMKEVADEILECDESTKLWKLKAEVRKACFAILGPAPEDYHWACPERLPKEPRPTIEEQIAAQTKVDDGQSKGFTKSETTVDNTNSPQTEEKKQPRRFVVPPEMTPEQMIQRLTDPELLELIKDSRWAVEHYTGRKATPFKKDLKLAEAEQERRSVKPESAEAERDRRAEAELQELEQYRSATTRRLNELLEVANYDVSKSDVGSVTHDEAKREIGIIHSELRSRAEQRPYGAYTPRQLRLTLQAARRKYNKANGASVGKQIDELMSEFRLRNMEIPRPKDAAQIAATALSCYSCSFGEPLIVTATLFID